MKNVNKFLLASIILVVLMVAVEVFLGKGAHHQQNAPVSSPAKAVAVSQARAEDEREQLALSLVEEQSEIKEWIASRFTAPDSSDPKTHGHAAFSIWGKHEGDWYTVRVYEDIPDQEQTNFYGLYDANVQTGEVKQFGDRTK